MLNIMLEAHSLKDQENMSLWRGLYALNAPDEDWKSVMPLPLIDGEAPVLEVLSEEVIKIINQKYQKSFKDPGDTVRIL